jgi:hypothetical protein
VRIAIDDKLGNEMIIGYLKAIFQYFSGQAEENHEKSQSP